MSAWVADKYCRQKESHSLFVRAGASDGCVDDSQNNQEGVWRVKKETCRVCLRWSQITEEALGEMSFFFFFLTGFTQFQDQSLQIRQYL